MKPARLLVLLLVLPCISSGQWSEQHLPSTLNLWDIYMVDTLRGWLATSGGIYHTQNEGYTWLRQDTNAVFELAGVSDVDVWAAGPAKLLHTTDGGNHWIEQSIASFLDSTTGFGHLIFRDSLTGWVVTRRGSGHQWWLLRTTDGGTTWGPEQSSNPIYILTFGDTKHGWKGDMSNSIDTTADGGITWGYFKDVGYPNLVDLHLVNSQFGWYVSDGPICTLFAAMTLDGGVSWYNGYDQGCTPFYLSFFASGNGWAVFADGWGQLNVSTSNDFGRTWTTSAQGVSVPFNITKMSFTDANHGWVIGDKGGILHTSTGILTTVKERSYPAKSALYQNYPNPANPATTITFSLPHQTHVLLRLFDVLGREVMLLKDETYVPGTYTVQVDGSRLSSGIYFYRLQAGAFSETKRLLLLK
jgi:photosystem II stability/assembly factor-like uncharacterized protein